MACQTEDYACCDFLGGFMSYLRNGWSVNLRAIENCIFSIRSIERNMRPILQTVYPTEVILFMRNLLRLYQVDMGFWRGEETSPGHMKYGCK